MKSSVVVIIINFFITFIIFLVTGHFLKFGIIQAFISSIIVTLLDLIALLIRRAIKRNK